jgi:hypothetical protein
VTHVFLGLTDAESADAFQVAEQVGVTNNPFGSLVERWCIGGTPNRWRQISGVATVGQGVRYPSVAIHWLVAASSKIQDRAW